MTIKPSVYAVGSAPPVLKRDPGAGAWGSVPATLGMKTLKELLTAAPVQALASHFGGDDAVKHLMHYLGNTGSTYTIDFQGLVDEVPLAKQVLDVQAEAAKGFVLGQPPGQVQFTSTTGSLNHYIAQGLSRNWFFAVGSYSTWGRGTGSVQPAGGKPAVRLEFELHFVDRYNWDGGKQVQIPIPGYDKLPGPAKSLIDKLPNVSGGRLTVTDKFMGDFHRQGLAKEFEMTGTLRRTVTGPPATAFPYKVRAGDTLSGVAKRFYGDPAKWPTIHAANKMAVPDPNVLRLGVELRIPV